MVGVADLVYEPRGASRELFLCRAPEVLIQGPAGTGKTRGALEYCVALCELYPGTRILLCRKTRTSMSETTLTTLEEIVLPLGHPARRGPRRQNRSVYHFPNGSILVVAGLDEPTRLFSSEYTLVFVDEANELTEHDWESLGRALRWKSIPLAGRGKHGERRYFHQLLGCCNPDSSEHFFVRRQKRGKTLWLYSKHEDNPAITPEYMARLDAMEGVRYKRLRLGLWTAAEGAVWANWDPHVHLLDAFPEADAKAGMPIRRDDNSIDLGPLGLEWFFGTIDWGWTKAGTFQVWGVDKKGRMTMVAEVYRKAQVLDWWGGVVETLHREFDLRTILADPEGKGDIEQMNLWLGPQAGRRNPWLVEGANNEVRAGLDQVRWALGADDEGVPRIRILRDCRRYGRDQLLLDDHLPTTIVEEIPAYVLDTPRPGREIKAPEAYELPDKRCEDHGCDAMRYAAMFAWGRDLRRKQKVVDYPAGSHGQVLGHAEHWKMLAGAEDDDENPRRQLSISAAPDEG